MNNEKLNIIAECGRKAREYLIKQYGSEEALSGRCKEAADLMIKALSSRGITASKHFGWCVLDNCDNISGEPCIPHCYVLVHRGRERLYLDCTATQFQYGLDQQVKDVILLPSGFKPYWFMSKKPTIKYMEEHCGY